MALSADQVPRNPMDFLFILGTLLFTAYGQIVTKWQVNDAGPLPSEPSEKIAFLLRLLVNPWIMSSVVAAFLAFVCWVGAMTKFELSYAYPFVSGSFVLVLVLSAVFFSEPISAPKVLGLALIILGIAIGSRA